ncbi:MAG: mucoidy inhibitor MuiA family protein [Mediterranea massiliensis]|nr:mucoidy inhibitor MuiA family protein [Mediterranea massiliensis]
MKRNKLTTKLISLLVLFVTIPTQSNGQEKINTDINKITVFIDGAQITRTKTMNLKAGENTLIFTGLSSFMDAKSMQVSAKGNLTVIGVNHRMNYTDSLERSQQQKHLENKISLQEKKKAELEAAINILKSRSELLKTNCSVGNRQTTTTLATIKELNNYYATEMKAITSKIIELSIQKEQLTKEEQATRAELTQLGNRNEKNAISEIEMKVAAKTTGQASFTISYYVKNAGWFPSYDIRSEGLNKPLQLSYKANIFQNTQEDWKDVSLTLSSSNPSMRTMPTPLRTYWLNYGLTPPQYESTLIGNTVSGIVTDNKHEPIIGATIMVPGTTVGVISDMNGRYSLTLPEGKRDIQFSYIGYVTKVLNATSNQLNVVLLEDKQMLEEAVIVKGYSANRKNTLTATASDMVFEEEIGLPESQVMEVEQTEGIFGYEFEIKQHLHIPSNGKAVTTEIARHELPALYSCQSTPRADKNAFVMAETTEWKKLNLLEGEANVYFENSFVGKSVLSPNQSGDTLHFSMGRDNNIHIQRTKMLEYNSRKFIGSNQVQTIGWKITIQNNRNEAINLQIQDQIPVSQNSSITVTTENLSGGQLNKENGIITWNLSLSAGQKHELELVYKVRYPKDRRLIIE